MIIFSRLKGEKQYKRDYFSDSKPAVIPKNGFKAGKPYLNSRGDSWMVDRVDTSASGELRLHVTEYKRRERKL
ncbi:MAG: hypothetical protein NC548_22845 [Lachnospiraceae bacterium]|nr:hypothetical protein [Lachnospiraceae bacterium]